MRKSLFKRFPVVFVLLVTVGVLVTLLAIERVIENVPYLYKYPLLMLVVGVSILAGTGTLYKKLG